jgi:hypothetical protein
LGAGMVRLVRIRNAHKGPKAKGSSRDLEPLGEPGPLAQSGAKVSLARLIPSSRFCSECSNGALAKPVHYKSSWGSEMNEKQGLLRSLKQFNWRDRRSRLSGRA